MHQHVPPATRGTGIPVFSESRNAAQPKFELMPRSFLFAMNLWHKEREPVRFETAELSLSISASAPESAAYEPIEYISILAGDAVASVSVPASLMSKILDSYAFPSDIAQREQIVLLLLEHRFAKALEALERHLKCPIIFTDIGRNNPASGPDIVCLGVQCRVLDSDYAIKLSLPAGLAVHLVKLLDVSAKAKHGGVNFPVPVAYRIGVTQLALRVLKSVQTSDVILADTAAGAGMSIIAIGEQFFARARWEGSTVTLLERPKKSSQEHGRVWGMSNVANSSGAPGAADAEFNDIQIKLVFELGRQEIELGDLNSLAAGYVFDLNRDPRTAVDIYAGTQRIGLGEIVQINETLGVRVMRLFNNE
jgi:type III secretion protein Q